MAVPPLPGGEARIRAHSPLPDHQHQLIDRVVEERVHDCVTLLRSQFISCVMQLREEMDLLQPRVEELCTRMATPRSDEVGATAAAAASATAAAASARDAELSAAAAARLNRQQQEAWSRGLAALRADLLEQLTASEFRSRTAQAELEARFDTRVSTATNSLTVRSSEAAIVEQLQDLRRWVQEGLDRQSRHLANFSESSVAQLVRGGRQFELEGTSGASVVTPGHTAAPQRSWEKLGEFPRDSSQCMNGSRRCCCCCRCCCQAGNCCRSGDVRSAAPCCTSSGGFGVCSATTHTQRTTPSLADGPTRCFAGVQPCGENSATGRARPDDGGRRAASLPRL